MDGAVSELYGDGNYFLGEQTYIDSLESTNKDNNMINEEHIRMRGVPTACAKYYAQQHNITVWGSYNKLYEGEAIEFDLTNEGNTFVCKDSRDHTVSKVTKLTRTTAYIRNENGKAFIT